jgi:hypothetical protein
MKKQTTNPTASGEAQSQAAFAYASLTGAEMARLDPYMKEKGLSGRVFLTYSFEEALELSRVIKDIIAQRGHSLTPDQAQAQIAFNNLDSASKQSAVLLLHTKRLESKPYRELSLEESEFIIAVCRGFTSPNQS